MLFRCAGIIDESITDGPGLRLTVFAQGCPHGCPGCHNPNTHDMGGGEEMDSAKVIERAARNPLLTGITLSGGEPFMQPKAMAEIALWARESGLSVIAYTGFTFEELLGDEQRRDLALLCDIIVDGPFMIEQKSLGLRFRGSSNQRVIDVKKSIEQGKTVETEFEQY